MKIFLKLLKMNSSPVLLVTCSIKWENQNCPPRIRPLYAGMKLIGRAMTVQEADCVGTKINHENKEHAFGVMFEALDSLQKGDIYLCSGSTEAYACWGELMSTRAAICGARGAVIDGYSRDTLGIAKLNFPTFSYGPYGQDQGIRGRVRLSLSFKTQQRCYCR